MSYDRQCYDLAQAFLEDEARDRHRRVTHGDIDALAQLIQTTIEDFIQFELPHHREGATTP